MSWDFWAAMGLALGIIWYIQADTNANMVNREKAAVERRVALDKEITERRENYVAEHADLDEGTINAILGGIFFRGMKSEEVRASLGDPLSINRSVGEWGVHEQWVYGSTNPYITARSYLYFENGILTSYQN